MKTENPLLSIIIISYNTRKITEDCLNSIFKSLEKSSIHYEIILIDNASTDDSVEKLTTLGKIHPQLKVIANSENIGFAGANNQGASIAKGEYFLFLNSDIIVLKNAIDDLFKFYKENENHIQFAGGKLLNKDLSSQASCGPFYSLPVIFVALFLRGDYFNITRYSPYVVKEVDWISGACILTKKEHFNQINGFDEKIFMYMDEIDMLYRAKQKSMRVFFYPDAKFIHLGSASSGTRTYPILQVYRGFLYFYKKHHDRVSMFLLKCMLQLKAVMAIAIGKLTRSKYLTSTYEEAYKLTKMG